MSAATIPIPAQEIIGAPTGGAPASVADAIFLHAGWRSCGTWLWEALRESPRVRGFYEPLHEGLAGFNRAALDSFRPDSWRSGHGGSAPYFAEYANFLNARGRGIALYRERFAFESFFMDAGDEDAPLRAYLQSLLDSARAEGRVPVLKFCRSHGRAAWMARQFPRAMHAVILRDPVAQWRSSRRQALRDGNAYFVVAPYLILSRNASAPLLADALRRLDVSLPPQFSADPAAVRIVCERHVQTIDWQERYRGFLALWAASAVAALSAGAMVIDAEAIADDTGHGHDVAAAFAAVTGQTPVLARARPRVLPELDWPSTAEEADDAARAALVALDFVAGHGQRLGAAQAALITRKLAPRFASSAGAPAATPTLRALPPAKPRRRRHYAARALDAALYLAYMRATWPLRRVHYYLDRWLRR